MPKRSEWRFYFPAARVAVAAGAKARYHRQRQTWWAAEMDKVQQAVREKGVELREYQHTGGARMTAVLDPDLGRRVDECGTKVDDHKRQAEQYEAFERALSLAGAVDMDLDVDDIRYFGL